MARNAGEAAKASAVKNEPRWHAGIAVLAALILYMRLPPKLTFGPGWMAPALVLVLLIPLQVFGPLRMGSERLLRVGTIALVAVLTFFNVTSVIFLINDLVNHHAKHYGPTAHDLLGSGAVIWMSNVIVFALWFYELDGKGPAMRARCPDARDFVRADFLFPQMTVDKNRLPCLNREWKPMLLDYVYLSFTNALAFSPTDTMPLSHWAKTLMLVESMISFATVGLILARSVNILS